MYTPTDRWLTTWLHQPLAASPAIDPDPVVAAMVPAITAYRQWCDADGLLLLRQLALRLTRDSDRAEDAVAETFLDVRDRMMGCVDRARAGRSLPGFRSVEDVARYHRIQVRLRIQGRWRHARPTVSLDDLQRTGCPLVAESCTERTVAARQHAVPLRIALHWTVADLPTRAAHKDHGWWWSMLLHGLDIRSLDDLGGARNDPTEVTDRLRVRLAVARGMGPTLRRWAADREGWSDLSVEIPESCPEVGAVADLLPTLRSAMQNAIIQLRLSEEESGALTRILVTGGTVRTNLRRFSGPDPRARMMALAESVGAAVGTAGAALVA